MSARPTVPNKLPADAGERVFKAPWEARAFAMVVDMSQRGLFAWEEFRRLLVEEIAREDRDAGPAGASGACYYVCWLRAAERLLSAKGLATPQELAAMKEHLTEQMTHEHAPRHRHRD